MEIIQSDEAAHQDALFDPKNYRRIAVTSQQILEKKRIGQNYPGENLNVNLYIFLERFAPEIHVEMLPFTSLRQI